MRLCTYHGQVVANLAHLVHIGDSTAEEVAVSLSNQCRDCGKRGSESA